MSLLETSRGTEAVAFLQRTLNRYPTEPECIAFAVALYQGLGNPQEASLYWNRLQDSDRILYSSTTFVSDNLHWGSKAVSGLSSFLKGHLK
jgi:hypothetical protein